MKALIIDMSFMLAVALIAGAVIVMLNKKKINTNIKGLVLLALYVAEVVFLVAMFVYIVFGSIL